MNEPLSDLAKAIIAGIEKIRRPLSIDELMPLTMPHCPHQVIQRTGRIVYDREIFCQTIQDLLIAGKISQKADQVRGCAVYAVPFE